MAVLEKTKAAIMTREGTENDPKTEEVLLLEKNLWKPWPHTRTKVKGCLGYVKRVLFVVGDDWIFLFALGVIMALISFTIDFTVNKMLIAHWWLFQELGDNMLLKFLSWTIYPIALTAFSTGFAQSVCPESAGSGVPEVKTILTGVVLEEYLTIKNFGAKVVGMTCTLAAGSPIFLGKVGPFVHLSCMIAAYLGRMRASATNEYENKNKQYEMLVAGAAVAMSSCFGAPVSETILAPFKTSFNIDFPFDLPEMIFFLVLGAVCGVMSCAYLFCQRWLLGYIRRNSIIVKLMATEKAVYSGLVALLLSSITFPYGLGQFMASRLTMRELLYSLFDNNTWIVLTQNASLSRPHVVDPENLWLEWWDPTFTVYGTIAFFLVMKFWMLVLATTMPMPAGYFMPVFLYGAAIGRLFGEVVAYFFPNGIWTDGVLNLIIPGGYAVAGAAAFSGAVTHTLSTALLALEMTGQLSHILPVLLSVLVANAIAQRYQPSFYDGTIIVKKLPYIPRFWGSQKGSCMVTTGQYMNRNLALVVKSWGFSDILNALTSSADTEFPVVESEGSMVLLGSVARSELLYFLHSYTGQDTVVEGTPSSGLEKNVGEVCSIQPITIQLSTQTSLYQAHELFELLNAQLMFVTDGGKLVGFVTRTELRKAIEDLALGKTPV
ncbi:UNVERIFIED_CONTAM: hypothetical protein FKN15_049816 [Acipenser sinensis]